ncbi:MAG: hypothetical protein ACD_7C00167G0002 [uncultured bacterium]|nr:MAG: hypothetical protein ACD_7C00167G0002 [uncultured bacterium]
MKKFTLLVVSLILCLFSLNGCAITYLSGGVEDTIKRNSTQDTCLELAAVAPRILHGKYYYDRCLFKGPGENTSWAYCPKSSLESGKMTLGQSYMVHANFWGNFGSTIDPNEGFFFNPDGEVISCQK